MLVLGDDRHTVVDVNGCVSDCDGIANYNVDADINVDGERRNIKAGHRIPEHI